jgi:hypothetical protein
MFQESVDRSHGSSKSDLILFLILVAAFFGIGGIVLLLESKINSTIPRYAFIALVLAGVYLIYRYRLIGYRYTVFYEAPKPVYDARFDDMMIHEDYPYPVGTVVFERIVSAKGVILLTVDKSEIEAICKPGEEKPEAVVDGVSNNVACRKESKSYCMYYRKDGRLNKLYFDPSEQFLGYLERIINGEESEEE